MQDSVGVNIYLKDPNYFIYMRFTISWYPVIKGNVLLVSAIASHMNFMTCFKNANSINRTSAHNLLMHRKASHKAPVMVVWYLYSYKPSSLFLFATIIDTIRKGELIYKWHKMDQCHLYRYWNILIGCYDFDRHWFPQRLHYRCPACGSILTRTNIFQTCRKVAESMFSI